MTRTFDLTKMPDGDSRFIMCDDGNNDSRRSFKSILGEEFYSTTVFTKTNLMRPEKTAEEFMQHVAKENPGSYWEELQPRIWIWRSAKVSS